MNSVRLTSIRFDDERTTLSDGVSPAVVLDVAASTIARQLFRHDPPQPGEMEQAIDWVEEALAATGLKQAARGDLTLEDPALFERLSWEAVGERVNLAQLEMRFQRLASLALGHPPARDDPPSDPFAAALLLVLRECMHHLGYDGLVRQGR